MLFKAIALALSTLFIAAVQISAADAGCGGGHGGYLAYQSKTFKRHALKQSQARKARTVAASRQRKPVQQARTETAEPATVAATEPTPTKAESTTDKVDVASADKNTCTRFVAETGTTVTFECAKR
jgi:sRNA-binding protein